jgi:hypothetical protein
MRTVFLTLVLLVVMCPLGAAEDRQLPFDKINKAAEEALNVLKDPAFAPQLDAVGFKSIEQAREASLGEPMQLYIVRLDQLKQYQPGDDPEKLLHPVDQVVYPVTVKGTVVSSVSVSKVDGEWVSTEIGQSNSAPKIANARMVGSRALKAEPSKAFIVSIPALNRKFVAQKGQQLMLVPIDDDADLGFKAEAAIPASNVFEALIPEAQEHEGLPR